jgi:hypothetical protein
VTRQTSNHIRFRFRFQAILAAAATDRSWPIASIGSMGAIDPNPTVVVRKSGRSPKPLACDEGMIDQPWKQRFQAWRRVLIAQSQSGWSRAINPHPFA